MSLETLATRMNYNGGPRQIDRMNEDKLRSLKKALLYSYQSATMVTKEGKEFRCLINPDKLIMDYDRKEISIPFADVCLNGEKKPKTTEGIEEIGLKVGDVFTWKEDNSDWITYLQNKEETAYFRATILLCRYELKINDNIYKIYFRGSTRTVDEWSSKGGISVNSLNYDGRIIITRNEETEEYLTRFKKIKVAGKNWIVQTRDIYSTEGIIDLYVMEDYTNTMLDEVEAQKEETKVENDIIGLDKVKPYDIINYSFSSPVENGHWLLDNKKAKIIESNSEEIKVEIMTKYSGSFKLYYCDGFSNILEEKEVTILPL